jgi:hypothetical protein
VYQGDKNEGLLSGSKCDRSVPGETTKAISSQAKVRIGIEYLRKGEEISSGDEAVESRVEIEGCFWVCGEQQITLGLGSGDEGDCRLAWIGPASRERQ